MNKEKLLKILKGKIGIGVISGVICFTLGGIMFSDSETVNMLKNENTQLTDKYKTEIEAKDSKINELQAKINEAKPWFDKQAEERAKIAEKERVEREKAEKAEKEKAEKEALAKGVNTEEVKKSVETVITNEIEKEMTNTKLDSLQINENLGTDSNKDVIVLADLSWSTKNTEKTTKEMLKMYSDHLAAKLAPTLAEGSEIALFWKAEYTGLSIKHSYYIKNGKAYMQ